MSVTEPVSSRVTALASSKRSHVMLKWALIFFVVSLIAGFFGFTGISAGAARISKWLFFIALAVFVVFLVLGLLAGEVIF